MSSGMNYLGSISILDRGDGPAQAVIDRNARSLAQRVADETRDELNKVMSRVHTIYGAMDSTEDFPNTATMEYLNDLAELEAILKDEIKKRQYQQQVTVFIVGYQDVCHQKLQLLKQVNEFFMENTKQIDEEDWFPTTPDMDLEEVSNAVEDSLNHAHELTTKLAVLNREMVDYMANMAEKKASNKGKKKIEKALQQARDEVNGLGEKLLTLQTELDDKEEKVANLLKQMDIKNLELQKYRTAAELGKKAAEEMEELQKQLAAKEAKIITQRQQLSKMEVELTQIGHLKDRSEQIFSTSDVENQQKITILQKELDEQRNINEEIKADMTRLLDNQISALHESHRQEMDELKKQHETEHQKMKGPDTDTPSEVARIVDLDSDPSNQTSRQSSKQESRPSTKDTKLSGKSSLGKSGKGSRSPTRRDSKPASRASGLKDGKEFAEVAIQDEGGDPNVAVVDEKSRTPNTRHSKRATSTLAPVLESDFDNAFDLFDDESWAAVPGDQVTSRFAQYRRLSTHRLLDLEEQLQLTNAKTKRKVNTLKAQFQEHKGKWEAERRILIEQVEQSLKLQTDAEKEADAAMTQLEDFITEQERLEVEEEVKRNEVLQSSASLTPQEGVTPLQGSLGASPVPGAQQVALTPESEQELQRLMQQTDDAKVQELNARLGSCVSAPPTVSTDKTPAPAEVEEQEVDNESAEDSEKQEAEVDLSQLKELPLLDIVDTLPPEESKPMSGFHLPSEATLGSSMKDPLETPFPELIEDDPIKMLKERERTKSQGELMDDGSNLERGRTHISEREATQAESEAHTDGQYEEADVQQSFSTISKQATDITSKAATEGTSKQATDLTSKHPTELSMGGTQRSMIRKSISSLEGMKIDGTTEEEIRSASAQSRASLRDAYKKRLEETKSAAEDRRSKSPHITVPTQMTIDDELILDEEDDDEEADVIDALPDELKEEFLAFKDPSMYEIGTSPPPGMPSRDPTGTSRYDGMKKGFKGMPSRGSGDPSKDPPMVQKIIKKGIQLLQHPLLREFLKTYNGVVTFKENMSKMFLDKDMMSAHQMTSDLEMLTFDDSQKAMPQVEELTNNVCHVLEEISTLISNILVYDREPPVSSLNLISREATQKSFVPPTDTISEQPMAPPATRAANLDSVASSRQGSKKSSRPLSVSSDKMHIRELQDQYNQLKTQLDQDSKQHQDQLQRNTVVMMEMQDTINDLHRELSALGKSAKRTKSATSVQGVSAVQKSPSPETSVMFTRLDSERNAKIMKKAVVEDKLDQEKYKEAVAKMDEYVSLPAQRLAHLVRKYVHHRRMRDIEEKVKNSSSLDEDVYDVLDKMENLQNQRARQWAESMDEMGIERLRLANLLMNTLENIEQESGIFLIKPMYSYRGRNLKPGTQGKLSRPTRSHHRNVTPSNDAASSFIPAPTPASNYRLVRHERHYLQQMQLQQSSTMAEMRPMDAKANTDDGNDVKVMGSGMTFSAGSPRLTWNMQASQPWNGSKEDPNSYNTPRILELDINRMLIGQNNISSKIPFPPTDDRLVNANQNSLRSYVTVNRPTAAFGADKTEQRPGSGREGSSRAGGKRVTVSETDKDIPATLPTASPLPPITPIPGEEPEDDEEEEEMEEMEDDVRPPSVAFTNDDEEQESGDGEENDDAEGVAREPPQSPPGSSLYQSTLRNEDSESVIKPTRASSRLTLSEDEN